MAQTERRLPENIEGEFYVDESCIDCDACRQIAPASFRDHGGQSSVYQQPQNPGEQHRAFMALVASRTASIGTASHRSAPHGSASKPFLYTPWTTFISAGSLRKRALAHGRI